MIDLPECPCQRCNPATPTFRRFTVCPDCGNKRCPKGTDHALDCSGSNEPGQAGSSYSYGTYSISPPCTCAPYWPEGDPHHVCTCGINRQGNAG